MTKITQQCLGLQSQCLVFRKNAWDCSPRHFWAIFVKNVNGEMGQICNISILPSFTLKLGKMPKMLKFAVANEPTAIYIYMLWSYYLGHVWGFLIVTNGATFVFLKRLFVKKHYKNRGFSRFLFQKKGDPKFLIVTNWATLPFFKLRKRGPVSNY